MLHASEARLGFPIRKSPDQRLLGTSPELIAPCNVLHRLLVSRHPPYALVKLRTTKTLNRALLYLLLLLLNCQSAVALANHDSWTMVMFQASRVVNEKEPQQAAPQKQVSCFFNRLDSPSKLISVQTCLTTRYYFPDACPPLAEIGITQRSKRCVCIRLRWTWPL